VRVVDWLLEKLDEGSTSLVTPPSSTSASYNSSFRFDDWDGSMLQNEFDSGMAMSSSLEF
jgi:hypothetical protein